MISIPLWFSDDGYDMAIVLQPENITRIQAYDPGEIDMAKMPAQCRASKLRKIHILFATDEEVNAFIADDPDYAKTQAFLKKLARGWKYMPSAGDSDDSYKSLIQ